MRPSEEVAIARKSVFWACALERVVRFAVAVPLLLCALVGFVVAVPLWLACWFWEMLGFDRSY